MTEKRFELIELYGDDHLIDNETNEKIGYDLHSPSTFNANWNNVCNLLNELATKCSKLEKENEQLKSELGEKDVQLDFLKSENNHMSDLVNENEQLKQVLGAILLEVKRDITNINQTGEIRVFINPNSFNLISEVLRKYGVLKEWYE